MSQPQADADASTAGRTWKAATTPTSATGRTAAFLATAVIGLLYGLVTSYLPMPQHGDVSHFWLGNLCAPWLLLAFIGGRTQTRWAAAALAGAVTDIACVIGFYLRTFDLNARWGNDSSAAPPPPAEQIQRWAQVHHQWLVAALVGGVVYGLLGCLRRHTRSRIAGLAIAAGFIAEPALWPAYNGMYKGPWLIWAVEIAVGAAIAWWVLASRPNPQVVPA